jgi:hypothetical protein
LLPIYTMRVGLPSNYREMRHRHPVPRRRQLVSGQYDYD